MSPGFFGNGKAAGGEPCCARTQHKMAQIYGEAGYCGTAFCGEREPKRTAIAGTAGSGVVMGIRTDTVSLSQEALHGGGGSVGRCA